MTAVEHEPEIATAAAAEPAQGIRDYLRRPLDILRGYRRQDLPPDVVAGLTVAAVAIPQSIAYASIAELPPQTGLYAAAVAAAVGSLWGSSRFLATGPVNAVSLLVLPILMGVAEIGSPGFLIAASTLALMVGVLNIVLAVLRFGGLVTLASRAVLIGFTAGAAIHIAVGQLKHLLRVDEPAAPELYNQLLAIARELDQVHPLSLGLGLGTLAVLLLLRRLGPRVPAALAAISAAAAAVAVFGLEAQGVKVVGEIPRSLPPLTWASLHALPDLDMIRDLGMGALAVAALGLVEAVASGQALARRDGDRIDANQEFFGQGLANLAAGLFSGYPCSGSFTRSAAAQQVGARTAVTGVVTGAAVMLGMLLLAPYARFIPRAAIAGVLLAIAWGMIERFEIRRVLRSSRTEGTIMGVTFAATLTQPLDFAILAGILFSLAFFVIRSSLPRVYQVVPDALFRHLVRAGDRPVCPQLAIMNIRGPLFFGAVHHIEEELRHNLETNPGQHLLVLRMHGVDIIDLSGIEMLEATVTTYRSFGGDVFFVRLREPVEQVMRDSGFLDLVGLDHVLPQEGAIEHLFAEVVDPAVCAYECEQRVFAECQALEKYRYREQVLPVARVTLDPAHHVTVEDFRRLAADPDALLIDVREPAEFARGHIPGARLLPLRRVLDEGPELARDRRLLLACRSGRRTLRAMHMLRSMGFNEVYGLRGGILAWQAAGLPVAVERAEDTRGAASEG
ncbi:MAG: SulP family inorganic anion transporter [Thermoanaerobaculales bacterium]|nr:SulP family inorganic anion transporter [Thermoanaerobaculales bacterium]